jgi:hypothetical protein
MSDHTDKTKPAVPEFDFSLYPADSLFHERRTGKERRFTTGRASGFEAKPRPTLPERREKKERRRRIDPTTFEKQYTDSEMEFMNAMQRFKERSGKAFPSHRDVLGVAVSLGYRKAFEIDDDSDPSSNELLI